MKLEEDNMKDRWWRFDRSDYVLLRAMIGLLVVGPVIGLVADLVLWMMGKPLRWNSSTFAQPPTVGEQVSLGASGTWVERVNWVIPHATLGQRLGSLLPSLWGLALAVVAAGCLWRLVRSLERGQTFTDASLRAVRALGIVLMAYAVLGWFVGLVADLAVMVPLRHNLLWTVDISPSALVLALVAFMVIAVAEVFRQGRDIAHDVEGLV